MQLNTFTRWRCGIVAAAGPGPAGPLSKPQLLSKPGPPPSPPPIRPPANGKDVGYSGNGAPKSVTATPPLPVAKPSPPPAPGQPQQMNAPRPPSAAPMQPPPPSALPRPGPPPPPPPRQAVPPSAAPQGAIPARPAMTPSSFPVQRPPVAPPADAGRPTAAPPSISMQRPSAAPPAAPSVSAAPSTPAASVPTPPGGLPTARPVANPFANIARPAAAAPPSPPQSIAATPPLRPAPAPPAPPAPAPPALPSLQRPPPRPTMGPPGAAAAGPKTVTPLAPPPQLPRPQAPAAPTMGAAGPSGQRGQPAQQLAMSRPPSRPDLLPPKPPAVAPTTQAAQVPADALVRPDPPTLRVLEPLMPPAGQVGKAGARIVVQEVVEEEDLSGLFDEEDMEFMTNKGSGLKAKGKRGNRKEKVTAEMKREARRQREATRMEKAASRKRDKEEIFEVGDEGMSLDALAGLLQVDESDIVRSLFMRGITLSLSQMLDKNTVKLVAADYDVVVVDSDPKAVTEAAKKRTEFITEEDVDDLAPRPPVVTVMGHVDHGKTSLLDHIRKARVAAGEAGGITQAIGAYNTEVEVDGERKTICFLDTPGHEAFSAMRARGAQVTDIAIIIVAADDGVRPQTREAVAHAQAAGVPIVVAINKVDKPGADVERVKQELLELNLVPEEWGGNTTMVPVSAKKGTGVQDLLTQLLWTAEEKQLMSNPTRPARGTVIEAYLDKKRGPVATLLVQAGTLRLGDTVRAGASYGKARALSNDLGQAMSSAGPSIAVQLIGLSSVPAAGEEFEVCPNEQAARLAAADFEEQLKMRRMMELSGGGSMVTLASLATVDEDQEALQRLNLIVKADTMGMVEAIKGALSQLPQQSVMLRFLLASAGEITVSDIDLAAASGGLVLAFNLEADENVSSHAKRLGVSVKSYRIIYELIDDVKAAMEGKLKLVEERVVQGSAVVKAIFGTGKKRVAGAAVTDGKLTKAGYITVKRGTGKAATVVYDGKLSSLRRVKDVVEEVSAGLECGVGADSFTDWAEGDSIECYLLVTKSRRLEEARATTAVDISTLQ